MPIQNYLFLSLICLSILISSEAGLYLIFRYRTELSRWAGLLLFGQALELIAYLLQWIHPTASVVQFIYLIQVLGYTLFCIFWLLFVFVFTQHPGWIRPRNLALMLALPGIYFLMMIALWFQAAASAYPGPVVVGSLMFSPFANRLPGTLFIIFVYGVTLFSNLVLLRFFSRSNSALRRLQLPLLTGPNLMAAVAGLELAVIHPLQPVSIHQLAIASICLIAFWAVFDLRFGSVLSSARETVIDQMQDGVLILDRQDRFVDLNAAAQRIFSRSSKNTLKQPLSQIWPEGAALLAAQSGIHSSMEETSLEVDGLEHTYDINISQLLDAYREPIGHVIVLRNVTEREQMEKALQERTQELQRTNTFLAGLAEAMINIQKTVEPARVLDIVGRELHTLGLRSFIAQLEPASNELVVSFLYTGKKVLASIEKLLGIRVVGYRLKRDQFLKLYNLLEGKQKSYRDQLLKGITSFDELGFSQKNTQIMRLIGLKMDSITIVVPLVVEERVLGLMGVWGDDLHETDVPPLNMFASQVAGILQNVNAIEIETRRANELARSNAIILALSNVATHLGTTSDLSLVFKTLGSELKKVGVNSMIGTFDDARQAMKVEYLSIWDEIAAWAEKLGAFWPAEITIPRRLWPTDQAITKKTPCWDPDILGTTAKIFPNISRQIFISSFKMAGEHPNDPVCYLPMISEEEVIGILAVWGPDLKHEDLPGFSVFANQVATAIRNTRLYDQAQQEIQERTQAEARIKAALGEKEVLLKEVHHRVKNNLQIISSLLNLQANQITDPRTRDALRDSQTRVRSMALIHEKLYQSPDLEQVDFAAYLKGLVNFLAQSYRANSSQILIKTEAQNIYLGIDSAIPCGLIVNELVSNSLKYAFPGNTSGHIGVSCQQSSEGEVVLVVRDDGAGMPAGFDPTKSSSLGLKLVTSLVQQLSGKLVMENLDGLSFKIAFPIDQ